MKLTKLVIRNFLSIREATVYLGDRGLVSVEGLTKDTDGADSNGAGKSSLINAILWCCYDDPGKKLDSVDDVVNVQAGKDCMVACHWLDEQHGVEYTITRYRKHSKFKNVVLLQAGTKDISKGTNPATQLEINKVLGADQPTFEASCFARQKDAPDIPGMTDTKLKTLLEAVLPLDNLSALYKVATANLAAQVKVVDDVNRELEKTELRIDYAKSQLANSKRDYNEWEENKEDRLYNIANQIEELKSEIDTAIVSIKPEEQLKTIFNKYRAIVDSYDDQPRQTFLANAKILERKVDKAWKDLENCLTECETCHRPFDNIEQQKAVLQGVFNAAIQEQQENEKLRLPFHKEIVAHKENQHKLERIIEASNLQERRKSNIARLKDRLAGLQVEYKNTPVNPFAETIKRLTDEASRYSLDATGIRVKLVKEQAKLPILEGVVETYSPKGVRYHILEEVTPFLNAQTNYYLSQLTDNKFKAIWSTVTKLKSGEYREKFSIAVNGGKSKGYGSLSGGEQRKVRLACFFALQDLIAKRATKSISLWCADEIDDALDGAGMERLMSLLHEKVKSKATIVVISHNELVSNNWPMLKV